jgi:hypothetical protein
MMQKICLFSGLRFAIPNPGIFSPGSAVAPAGPSLSLPLDLDAV